MAIQDTTSLRDESNTSRRSLHLHPTIAIDAAGGSLLGLIDAQLLTRVGGKRASRKARPFEQKESRRWLNATIASAELMDAGAACVTVIADREGDIYEEFALRPPQVDLVIRAQQDRMLAYGSVAVWTMRPSSAAKRLNCRLAPAAKRARRSWRCGRARFG